MFNTKFESSLASKIAEIDKLSTEDPSLTWAEAYKRVMEPQTPSPRKRRLSSTGACNSLSFETEQSRVLCESNEFQRRKVTRRIGSYSSKQEETLEELTTHDPTDDDLGTQTQHTTPIKPISKCVSVTSVIHWMIEISGYSEGENRGRPYNVSVELCPDGKFTDNDGDSNLIYTQIIGQGGKIAEFLYNAKMKNININISLVPESDNTFSIVQMNGYRFNDLVPEYVLVLSPSKIRVKRPGGSPGIERPRIASEVISPGRALQVQQPLTKTSLNWFWEVVLRISLDGTEKHISAEISQNMHISSDQQNDLNYKQGIASGFGGAISSILHNAKKTGQALKVTYGLVNGRLTIGSIGDYILNGSFPDEISLLSGSIKHDSSSVMERLQLPIAVRKATEKFKKRDSEPALNFGSIGLDNKDSELNYGKGKERSQSCTIQVGDCVESSRVDKIFDSKLPQSDETEALIIERLCNKFYPMSKYGVARQLSQSYDTSLYSSKLDLSPRNRNGRSHDTPHSTGEFISIENIVVDEPFKSPTSKDPKRGVFKSQFTTENSSLKITSRSSIIDKHLPAIEGLVDSLPCESLAKELERFISTEFDIGSSSIETNFSSSFVKR